MMDYLRVRYLSTYPTHGKGKPGSLPQGTWGTREGTSWTGYQHIAGHNVYIYISFIQSDMHVLDWGRKPK